MRLSIFDLEVTGKESHIEIGSMSTTEHPVGFEPVTFQFNYSATTHHSRHSPLSPNPLGHSDKSDCSVRIFDYTITEYIHMELTKGVNKNRNLTFQKSCFLFPSMKAFLIYAKSSFLFWNIYISVLAFWLGWKMVW